MNAPSRNFRSAAILIAPPPLGNDVHEHIAVGLQFDYMWTWYGLAVLDHPQQKIPIPMRLLQGTPATQGVNVRDQLPQFWTLGLALRGRL